MTNIPPSDDNLSQDPPPYEEESQLSYAQENLQEHAFQNTKPYREASGFGFVALIAGLICLVALSGIVIYSLLLAPAPPRQPILIEVEGTTKQAPADAQLKPEPNSNVGVFRMLRGEETPQPANETKNLIAKPGATQEKETEAETETEEERTVDVLSESSAEAEQPQTEKEKGAEEDKSTALKSNVEKATPKAREATTVSGKWYVQIAALESKSAADKAWAKLHDQLPELFYTQNYVAKATTLASGKRVWRLLLGPQSQQQAETLCRELKTRARRCLVKKITP